MDYRQALDYILGFTDYEKTPAVSYAAANFDLRRMEALLGRLGNPHLGRPTVHIAGTKGKGSTAALVASVLQAAGYGAGLFTSPHLHTFRERIRISGQLIAPDEVARLTAEMQPQVEAVNAAGEHGRLTTFELITALAFLHFQRQQAEVQVIETGLGGRLDATNVVAPTVSVITSISYDHMAILGSTLAQIATEKAGIIKAGRPVVSAPQEEEAAAVIAAVCAEKGAKLTQVGRDVVWTKDKVAPPSNLSKPGGQSLVVMGRFGEYPVWIPLLGEHQLENAAVAVAVLEVLKEQGLVWNPEALRQGLAQVSWPGRLEVLGRAPWLVVDGAHNGESARALVAALKQNFHFERVILLFGASADKDVAAMAAELAALRPQVIATAASHPRSASAEAVAQAFVVQGLAVEAVSRVSEALSRARAGAGPGDLIIATGSLFLVAEVRQQALGLEVADAA